MYELLYFVLCTDSARELPRRDAHPENRNKRRLHHSGAPIDLLENSVPYYFHTTILVAYLMPQGVRYQRLSQADTVSAKV